jgi:hypothetical protein
MLQLSAELETILCSGGRRFFSSLKDDKKGYFEKRIFADTQTIYDWLNGEIQKPVRPENSLSAAIYKVTL